MNKHVVVDAIEAVFPVIELHHYLLRSHRPCFQELIASNGMHAGLVWAEEGVAGFARAAGSSGPRGGG